MRQKQQAQETKILNWQRKMETSKREVSKEKGMGREFNTIYGMDEGLKNSRPCVLLLNDASK